jgi:erythronate-4-phosphate dehydrogenase
MKIVIDENIAFAREFFSGIGDVETYPGRQLTREEVKDADVLLVRSVTKINKALLAGTCVKFVGTCTIGVDHVDQDYLAENEIGFANAAGCNAGAVADYVLSALAALALAKNFSINDKCIGIIGRGNVGRRLTARLENMGVECLCVDPPLQRRGIKGLMTLDEVINRADIISLHTPLTKTGADATFHMINAQRLQQLKPGAILINTSRGAVINNQQLLSQLVKEQELMVVLDVWENEPFINIELLKHVALATQHIAGYSLEGKITGTAMIYKAVCDFLNKPVTVDVKTLLPPKVPLVVEYNRQHTQVQRSYEAILACYDVRKDDALFRKTILAAGQDQFARAAGFDDLRKYYPQRREMAMTSIPDKVRNTEWVKMLQSIGIDEGG